MTSLKLTEQTKPAKNRTGLLCLFISIPKESEAIQPLETVSPQRVFGI
jgi:hypothetical protein